MEKILDVQGLSILYKNGYPALKNISLSLSHREILGIVGESGSGKTTLIRCLINLLPPDTRVKSDMMQFEGQDLGGLDGESWRRIRGNRIGMIFQNPGSYLNPIIRVGRQFIESIRAHRNISRQKAREKALHTLARMQLKDPVRIMDSYPFQLSGGMKQRVAIAMSMAMEPKLLLADEPTSALDVKTQSGIIGELMCLREQFDTSIIIVTHNICCSAHMADRLIVMKQGEVVESGRTTELLIDPQESYTQNLLHSIPNLKVAEEAESCLAFASQWKKQLQSA